jgi:peroxiredoxin Q/BCP
MAKSLEIGDEAPGFCATAVGGEYGSGKEVSLTDFKGKFVVLYFYPKDDTPGCTKQACALRDSWQDIKDRAVLFGVSVDPVKSHTKFIEKYQLPFPLLSDSAHDLAGKYGVWIEKTFMGRTAMGVERSTFVIDGQGRMAGIFRKVKPEEHVGLLSKALP